MDVDYEPAEDAVPADEIMVCNACGSAACWAGVLLCDEYRTSGTTTLAAFMRRPDRGK